MTNPLAKDVAGGGIGAEQWWRTFVIRSPLPWSNTQSGQKLLIRPLWSQPMPGVLAIRHSSVSLLQRLDRPLPCQWGWSC